MPGPSKPLLEEGTAKGPFSVIDFLDHLLAEAHAYAASDIHIDPEHDRLRVRFRIDGILQDIASCPKGAHAEVVTRIKILAGMRTDEHVVAQEGRFRSTVAESGFMDVRVSIAPTYHGENVVLRLLSNNAESFTLETLGLSALNQTKLAQVLHKPYGMILATGPTGSGKTTTLYTLLKLLNKADTAIITIEDPIEYAVSGVVQIQTNPRMGLTFANGLRSMLRQDPNIIMVGEIRDAETAGIAVNTSLTGHLLLSTLHTTNAATILPRLLDLSVEPYLIAATVNAAIGQRLVRKICNYCKEERALSAAEQQSLPESVYIPENQTVFNGKGCQQCKSTGYLGRVGIYEVLVVEKQIREAILAKSSASVLHELAVEHGMVPMFEDGMAKVFSGITTLEEVLRTLHE